MEVRLRLSSGVATVTRTSPDALAPAGPLASPSLSLGLSAVGHCAGAGTPANGPSFLRPAGVRAHQAPPGNLKAADVRVGGQQQKLRKLQQLAV